MNNGIKIAKELSSFKKELNAKLDEGKGINYKTVVNFIQTINTLLGQEVIKCEVSEVYEKHYYKVSNRLRYNDTFKSGVDIKIDFLGERYTAHTSEQYQSYNLASFMSRSIGVAFDTAKKLGQAINN